jgi:hypothetical protein
VSGDLQREETFAAAVIAIAEGVESVFSILTMQINHHFVE